MQISKFWCILKIIKTILKVCLQSDKIYAKLYANTEYVSQ